PKSLVDVHWHIARCACRQHCLLGHRRSYVATPIHPDRLPFFHFESRHLLSGDALPEQHCTVLGRDGFLRLGQRRFQPFHPYRLLGVHVRCIQPRSGQTPLRVHQRGRRAWRHRRCVSCRSAREKNRGCQFAHHFSDSARGGSVVRAIFPCCFQRRSPGATIPSR